MKDSEDIWTRKLKAFLWTPPDAALAPDDAEARASEYISTALETPSDQGSVSEDTKKANRMAAGLDIPPLVEKAQRAIFVQEPLLTHPLSGDTFKELEIDLSSFNPEQTKAVIRKAIESIRKEIELSQDGFDPVENPSSKRLFLALWRKLPEAIREQESSRTKLGPWWDLLPADPRIPSHSVWDHAAIASAIASAGTNPAFLIFTIASPQQFISTARRTQDSWMGSYLLSYLTWAAIEVIADKYGPDCLIFPSLRGQPLVDLWLADKKKIKLNLPTAEALEIANFPNMMTAIVPHEHEQAEAIAKAARAALLEKWKEIAGAVKSVIEEANTRALGIDLSEDAVARWNVMWQRQLADCFPRLGIFWVVCPWGDDPKKVLDDYRRFIPTSADDQGTSRQWQDISGLIKTIEEEGAEVNTGMTYQFLSSIAARALTARKNLRDFGNQQSEPGEKCTLCGVREAIHPDFEELRIWSQKNGDDRQLSEYKLLRKYWEQLSRVEFRGANGRVKLRGRIRRGDLLCAVCLVKRLALDFYFEPKFKQVTKQQPTGFDRHLFPSTASIAAAPFKAEVIKLYGEDKLLENYVQRVKSFLAKMKPSIYYESSSVPKLEAEIKGLPEAQKEIVKTFLRIDGEWLFEEAFDPVKIERENQIEKLDAKAEGLRLAAVQSLKELLDTIKENKDARIRRPSRYYAVVAMDGDKMGEWLSGKIAPQLDWLFHPQSAEQLETVLAQWKAMGRPLGAASHLALSAALKNFALEIAPWVVEEQHYGKLIYAGADDVIAFVPVDNLLSVIRNLRLLFQGDKFADDATSKKIQAQKGFATVRYDDDQPERQFLLTGSAQRRGGQEFSGPTASLGVAIIHESYPLPQAIEEAFTHAMKTHAKDKLGRDAIAIHLNKRAGEPLMVGFKWFNKSEATPTDILETLERLVAFIRRNILSSRLAYDMNQKALGLTGPLEEVNREPWWHEAQKRELARLLPRHLKSNAPETQRREAQQKILQLLEMVHEQNKKRAEQLAGQLSSADLDDSWATVAKMILLARFLAGEE